jgi:hypothetical protein
MFNRFKQYLIKHMYHEDTAMILNYVTLKISNPEVS